MLHFRDLTIEDLQPFTELVCVRVSEYKGMAENPAHKHGGVYEIGHLTAENTIYMENEHYATKNTFNLDYILHEGDYALAYPKRIKRFILREWITDEDLFALKLGSNL